MRKRTSAIYLTLPATAVVVEFLGRVSTLCGFKAVVALNGRTNAQEPTGARTGAREPDFFIRSRE